MERLGCMLIAGEASGDHLAAELVAALRSAPMVRAMPFGPRFFGAGGPAMAAAGVECAFDLTEHAVVGLAEVLRHYATFRRIFNRMLELAGERRPDVVILVDFSGFNRRFARALRAACQRERSRFGNWRPAIVQYVSPQVWASRPGRAYALAEDIDLLLSIFPFEKTWYAQRIPKLRVEFVGHPVCERFAPGAALESAAGGEGGGKAAPAEGLSADPLVLLLPGSRERELRAHLPVMLEAAALVSAPGAAQPGRQGAESTARRLRWRMVLPGDSLASLAREWVAREARPPARDASEGSSGAGAGTGRAGGPIPGLEVRVGGLAESLAEAQLAIAASGTVTVECAWFGVPTVVLYKTSWLTYQIARRIVSVKHLAMPNLLAGEAVYPEFIQDAAVPERVAAAAAELLWDEARRASIRSKLAKVMTSLGGPGASARAAQAVLSVLPGARPRASRGLA
jgi:lipid-A-disaccharide synthase